MDDFIEPAQRMNRAGTMTITLAHLQPVVSLICGILIIIMPQLLNFSDFALSGLSGHRSLYSRPHPRPLGWLDPGQAIEVSSGTSPS